MSRFRFKYKIVMYWEDPKFKESRTLGKYYLAVQYYCFHLPDIFQVAMFVYAHLQKQSIKLSQLLWLNLKLYLFWLRKWLYKTLLTASLTVYYYFVCIAFIWNSFNNKIYPHFSSVIDHIKSLAIKSLISQLKNKHKYLYYT